MHVHVCIHFTYMSYTYICTAHAPRPPPPCGLGSRGAWPGEALAPLGSVWPAPCSAPASLAGGDLGLAPALPVVLLALPLSLSPRQRPGLRQRPQGGTPLRPGPPPSRGRLGRPVHIRGVGPQLHGCRRGGVGTRLPRSRGGGGVHPCWGASAPPVGGPRGPGPRARPGGHAWAGGFDHRPRLGGLGHRGLARPAPSGAGWPCWGWCAGGPGP